MTDAEVDRLILDGRAVPAVKLIRERTGCDLETAVEVYEVRVGKPDDRHLKAYAEAGGYVLLYHDGWFDRLQRLEVAGIEEALAVFGEFDGDDPAFLERPWQLYTDEV